MLKDEESGTVCSTEHEGVEPGVRNAASVLATDVQEERSVACPVIVVDPPSLLECTIILSVVVVHQILECSLFKVVYVNVWQIMPEVLLISYFLPEELEVKISKLC